MDHDLTGLFQHGNVSFETRHIKCLAAQLFRGLAFLHHKHIMHRDIKGANILVNRLGQLKIADFGLARAKQTDRYTGRIARDYDYTNRVVTLWYRAPELLLGEQRYSYGVDVWAAGCIFLEFYTKQPVFRGNTEVDQSELIWRVCGSPTSATWPEGMALPWYKLLRPKDFPRKIDSTFK